MTASDWFWSGVYLAAGLGGFLLTVAVVIGVGYLLMLAVVIPALWVQDKFRGTR